MPVNLPFSRRRHSGALRSEWFVWRKFFYIGSLLVSTSRDGYTARVPQWRTSGSRTGGTGAGQWVMYERPTGCGWC